MAPPDDTAANPTTALLHAACAELGAAMDEADARVAELLDLVFAIARVADARCDADLHARTRRAIELLQYQDRLAQRVASVRDGLADAARRVACAGGCAGARRAAARRPGAEGDDAGTGRADAVRAGGSVELF